MIFVRDKGRMCNNILQYGHVYAWAHEHERRSVSMRFCYKYQYFNICSSPYHNFFTYIFAKYAAKCGLLPVAAFHNPKGNAEAMATLESKRNVVVEGWEVRFYDLFLKYRREITEMFDFRPAIKNKISNYISKTAKEDSLRLGVHIRRGDYKTWKGGKYFYDDDTYINYICQFAKLHEEKTICIYICGNDTALDKQNYESRLQGMAVHFPNGNPAEDLCLLSECDYIIGAPSTFSLVAAMYRDIPLCWMLQPRRGGGNDDFQKFEQLFRNIK